MGNVGPSRHSAVHLRTPGSGNEGPCNKQPGSTHAFLEIASRREAMKLCRPLSPLSPAGLADLERRAVVPLCLSAFASIGVVRQLH